MEKDRLLGRRSIDEAEALSARSWVRASHAACTAVLGE